MPACSERESSSDEAEADEHIPSADLRDWIAGIGHVVDDDPDEASEEGSDHSWREPGR